MSETFGLDEDVASMVDTTPVDARPHEKLLANAKRDVALALAGEPRLRALEAGSRSLALAVRHGFISRADVIDALWEQAKNSGMFDEASEYVVCATIARGLNEGVQANGHARSDHQIRLSEPEPHNPTVRTGQLPVILSKRQFIEGFVPPDNLIDGVLQRGYVYAITAPTGHAKTALALLITRLVGRPEGEASLGPHAVDRGNVIYFAGENPDDLRMRVIGDDAKSARDGSKDNISFLPGVFSISEMRLQVEAEAKRIGGFDLVIIDTSAAYFLGTDELSNTQMGAHARTLRTLTTLPGHPTVIVLCHPIKHATEPAQLLPRGGGAFLAEIDGNLTLWKKDDVLVELWHGKMRGAGFEPMTFRLEKIITPALTDSKGRLIPTVRAVPVTEHEEETEARFARSDEDELLVAMLEPGQSVAQLAAACGWRLQNGDPHKSKAHRVMLRLHKSGLVKNHRETWQLTDRGKSAANAAKHATDAHRDVGKRYGD